MNIHLSIALLMILPAQAIAAGYELIYKEEENGVEPYLTRLSANDRFMRIDDLGDDSGYVLFDNDDKTVYSVNHDNRTILEITRADFEKPTISKYIVETDEAIKDAPQIGGKQVYDYRVEFDADTLQETCTHIQYVPGLLQPVGMLMNEYQRTMAGSHVRTLDQVPAEFQTPCMLSDQVYFDGAMFAKGIPIMEWHSNGRKKFLQTWKQSEPDKALFDLPEEYRRIRLN